MKRKLGIVLRCLVAFGILYYLFRYKVDAGNLWETARHAAWGWLLLSIALFGLTFWLGAVRWHLLVESQGIRMGLPRVVVICFVGQFFNSFLPSGTGGDVVRAYYASRQTTTHRTEAITSILVDRLFGLAALVTFTAIMIALHLDWLWQQPALRGATLTVLVVFASAAIGVALFWRGVPDRLRWVERLSPHFSVREIITRAIRALQAYREQKDVLIKAFLYSLGLHLSNFVGAIFIGWALGIARVNWHEYLLIVPLINTIASLPVTVAGLGVREELYRRVLGEMGVPAEQAVALGLLNYGVQLFWSLIGGIVYAFWKHESQMLRHARDRFGTDGHREAKDGLGRELKDRS